VTAELLGSVAGDAGDGRTDVIEPWFRGEAKEINGVLRMLCQEAVAFLALGERRLCAFSTRNVA
jgi:hypothetical protein